MAHIIEYMGIVWKFQLEQIDDVVYFSSRWELLFGHHNLENNYFLVFEYNGSSTFEVIIFDLLGIEV